MSTRKPSAAGAPLALCTMLGALIGAIFHQPSLGLVLGLGVGTSIAIVVWLIDREKIGE